MKINSFFRYYHLESILLVSLQVLAPVLQLRRQGAEQGGGRAQDAFDLGRKLLSFSLKPECLQLVEVALGPML